MEMLKESPVNLAKIERANRLWKAIFDEVLLRGYHGRASIEMTITDGTIQRIARNIERVEK
jgi:hypothetical protein